MFERFTDRARRSVVLAQEEARLLNHDHIGTEHLLLGLIREGEGVAAQAMDSLGISLEPVRAQVSAFVGPGGAAQGGHVPFTPRAKKVLELSLREALQLGHDYIGTEHILLGVIREGEGVAPRALVALGFDLAEVRRRVTELAQSEGAQGREHAPARPGRASAAARLPAGILAAPGALPVGTAEGARLDRVVPLGQEIALPGGERLVLVSLEIWSAWMTLRSALLAGPGSTLARAPELVLSFLLSDAAGTHYEYSGGASSGVAALRFQQAVFQPSPPAGTERLTLTAFGVLDKELAMVTIELGGAAAAAAG
jgi:Clp amino terminal domain, pathogenicity island component